MIPREQWEWSGHACHLIVGTECRFHLATYIGDFLVSTVGEWLPEEGTREILAKSRGVTLEGIGDARRHDYMMKVGFEEIGAGEPGHKALYETMAFRLNPTKRLECGCREVADFSEIAVARYDNAKDASNGHETMCRKFAKRKQPRTSK
jgi:hypothetical protein